MSEKKGKYNIISDKYLEKEQDKIVLKNTAIIVNLYYIEMVDYFFSFLKNVPTDIDIYVISSREDVLEQVKYKMTNCDCKNITLLSKSNRGRDISALLVRSKEFIMNYKYVCFVHDKKAKREATQSDIERWVSNLWNSTLASEVYIHNILNYFENNQAVGILTPHEPLGIYNGSWYGDTWTLNYDNVLDVLRRLGIECEIDKEDMPITLGTVFWCRVNSLKKLFEYNWKYEDFDEEPLKDDGTISHAIERVIGYVAREEGYKTERVMTISYAEEMLWDVQNKFTQVFDFIDQKMGVNKIIQMQKYDKNIQDMSRLFAECEKVYLYGAGMVGARCLKWLRDSGYEPEAFVVTNKNDIDEYQGKKVLELSEIEDVSTSGFFVSVAYKNQDKIIKELEKIGAKKFEVYSA